MAVAYTDQADRPLYLCNISPSAHRSWLDDSAPAFRTVSRPAASDSALASYLSFCPHRLACFVRLLPKGSAWLHQLVEPLSGLNTLARTCYASDHLLGQLSPGPMSITTSMDGQTQTQAENEKRDSPPRLDRPRPSSSNRHPLAEIPETGIGSSRNSHSGGSGSVSGRGMDMSSSSEPNASGKPGPVSPSDSSERVTRRRAGSGATEGQVKGEVEPMEVDGIDRQDRTSGPSASIGEIAHADRPMGDGEHDQLVPKAEPSDDRRAPSTARSTSASTSAPIKEQGKSHEPSEYAYEYVHVVQVCVILDHAMAC